MVHHCCVCGDDDEYKDSFSSCSYCDESKCESCRYSCEECPEKENDRNKLMELLEQSYELSYFNPKVGSNWNDDKYFDCMAKIYKIMNKLIKY